MAVNIPNVKHIIPNMAKNASVNIINANIDDRRKNSDIVNKTTPNDLKFLIATYRSLSKIEAMKHME